MHLIQICTHHKIGEIISRLYLEIGVADELFSLLQRSTESVLTMQKHAFVTYNRLEKAYSPDLTLFSPAFSIENMQDEPKFSLEVPHVSAPLLLFEPDRLIYVCYVACPRDTFVLWTDSFGEWRHELWMPNFKTPEELVEFVFEQTVKLLGKGGFIPRLIVCEAGGWNPERLSSKIIVLQN